jgi:hypothetical protein
MGKRDFAYAPPKGKVVQTRFGLRREPETKKSNEKPSIFSYGEPGHGPNGESSN